MEPGRNHGGTTAVSLSTWRSHWITTAVWWRCHGDLWRQYVGVGGSTAGPVSCHCRAGGATAVALRQHGGSMTSARRLYYMGCGFRSYYRFRCCWGRCYCYYCYYILLLFISLSYAAETCYCTAVVGYCGGTAVMEVLLRSLYGSMAVMAVYWIELNFIQHNQKYRFSVATIWITQWYTQNINKEVTHCTLLYN